jgi:translation initiation factor 4G
MYAARAVCDQIISVSDLAHLMKHGDYYPLFFLCMQNMHKLKTPEWLRSQLEQSKVNLVDMLPAADRNKERLVQILEDRELSFVYPMLKIEATLFEKIQANLSSVELKQWIESHVDLDVRMSMGFIQSLVACIVKNAAESSLLSEENEENNKANFNSKMDKMHVAKQKQSIEKYQDLLQEYLSSKLTKQVEAIYAMQVYASSKGFPKYFLAHLFNQMYDLEIIDEEAFYLWKDEINENYPDKGQALFHLQRWFNWLQEASEESSDGESEKNSTSKRKTQNQAKMLQNVEEINVDLTASIK